MSHIKWVTFNFRFNGKVVEIAGSSVHDHSGIHHLASYRGHPLTTGSGGNEHHNVKTEIMDLDSRKWKPSLDYPIGRTIWNYATASTATAAYIIGGGYGTYSSETSIVQFKGTLRCCDFQKNLKIQKDHKNQKSKEIGKSKFSIFQFFYFSIFSNFRFFENRDTS